MPVRNTTRSQADLIKRKQYTAAIKEHILTYPYIVEFRRALAVCAGIDVVYINDMLKRNAVLSKNNIFSLLCQLPSIEVNDFTFKYSKKDRCLIASKYDIIEMDDPYIIYRGQTLKCYNFYDLP